MSAKHLKARDRVLSILYGVSSVLSLWLLAVLLAQEIKPAPGYAIVFVDIDQRAYLAPPCFHFLEKHDENFSRMTLREARELGFEADEKCQNEGAFFQEGRWAGLPMLLLERIGMLSPPTSRWNSDGTWNW